MQKHNTKDFKVFEFDEIKGSHIIKQESKFESFAFKNFDNNLKEKRVSEEVIRQERNFEKKTAFKIEDIVRESRGLIRQEQTDFEKKVEQEVKRRLESTYQQAYDQGLNQGKEEGKEEALTEYRQVLMEKVESLNQHFSEIQLSTSKIIEKNKSEAYEFIKRFSKWIIFKEINEKLYLEQLLEKLILELNSRRNLIVKVGKENFSQMPEVVQAVESRLGQLQNVRIEIVPELNHPGIILESENGLIDGSLEGVFQNIDKIFEQVVGHE
ncbi:MAG: hypothetical protein AB7I27_10300 [Bacteriovoracaceae bacterium]